MLYPRFGSTDTLKALCDILCLFFPYAIKIVNVEIIIHRKTVCASRTKLYYTVVYAKLLLVLQRGLCTVTTKNVNY